MTQMLSAKIERLCQGNYQSKNEIKDLTSSVSESVSRKIKTSCYTNEEEALKDCDNEAKDKVAQYIAGKAQQLAEEEATKWRKNSPINPRYVSGTDPIEYAVMVGKLIGEEVSKRYASNNDGALQGYLTDDSLKQEIINLTQENYTLPWHQNSARREFKETL